MSSKSNTQILQELEDLSDSLYQSHTSNPSRRTASLALPRDSFTAADAENNETTVNPKPRTRRMSLSPWRSRPAAAAAGTEHKDPTPKNRFSDGEPRVTEKKGIWNWKPIRALSHIGMQKLSCLFSVEVVAVQNLPATMNGLRLSVCVRKKETRDGAVQTMPSRVTQGAADFEETLFIRCHVYYTPAGGGARMKFEPRPFVVYALAVDAEELDFGRSSVDLSGLIQESVERNFEGTRIRQWDRSFKLAGKARGGELLLKLGFQIMEKDGGTGIYSATGPGPKVRSSPSFGRKQSKTSFSVHSPKMSAWTPSRKDATSSNGYQEIEVLNLDEPPVEEKTDDLDLPDFEVVDKGVEIDEKKQENEEEDEELQSEESSEKRSVTTEVVKEVVQDKPHTNTRLSELDSIAQQIKALESMMGKKEEETGSPTLDDEEDKVTREFYQMLENDDDETTQITPQKNLDFHETSEKEESVFVPDLGKGLGCVVQTRNGGYLTSANPFDTKVGRKETPKLAMQMSKPMMLKSCSSSTGFEIFQRMAGMGLEGLTSKMMSVMPIEELKGKTAEQVAFEGIASAIIEGRNKEEGASSSAARSIAKVKRMVNAMVNGRKERVLSGIWNVREEGLSVDEIVEFSVQKIESMAVEGLKIQADVAEEEAPFEVFPIGNEDELLGSAVVPIEEGAEKVVVAVVVQLRDPVRQYEGIGGPMIVVIHAHAEGVEGEKYKVGSIQVGGVFGKKSGGDMEKEKVTAVQWAAGMGMGKKGRRAVKGADVLWSISSRVMADMWLKPIRNPDVKFVEQKSM